MTMRCALSQSSIAAHHRPCSAAEAPAGGVFPLSDCLKAAGVMPGKLLLPPFFRRERTGGVLNDRAERKQRLLSEWLADELQPERQALAVKAAGHGDGRQPGHWGGHGEHVVEIHLNRVGASAFADRKSR